MATLVIVEHDHQQISDSSFHTLGAAHEIGGDIDLLVMEQEGSTISELAASIPGIRRVMAIASPDFANPLPEDMAPLVVRCAEGYSHLLAAADTFGKNLMPRVAALLDVPQVSDISAVIDADTFERPIYAGNAIATVRSTEAVKVITVRPTKFQAVATQGGEAEKVVLNEGSSQTRARFVSRSSNASKGPELTSSRVVVSGCRGMGNGDNFVMLDRLAEKLGGAVGASRAAVDAGFVPNDYQVGQTGKVVAPDLYIAVGISGAIQHLAGMKDSKVIVAINKDVEAPIFQIADYGIVGDLFEVLPDLEKAL